MRLLGLSMIFGLVVFGCGDDGGGGGGGGDAGGPNIVRIEWTQAAGCTPMTASDVTVTVTVEGGNAASYSFSGMVPACGMLTGATTTVTCPQRAPYMSTVTVTDGMGSDTETFTVGVCEDGSMDF